MSDIIDDLKDDAGKAIGEAELLGLRYPVKAYQSKVSDRLTRGSRLDSSGLADLVNRGFRGCVNLCAEMSLETWPGLVCYWLPLVDNTAPTENTVRRFLDFASGNFPCYVHCEAGVGRTGTMVACYRISVMGWKPADAVAEAESFGLAMPCQKEFIMGWRP